MRLLVSAVCTSVLAAAVAGCGGSSASDQLANQIEINQAKRDAVKDAKRDMRIRDLQRRLRNSNKGSAGSSSPASSAPTSAPTPVESSSSDFQSFHTPGVSCQLDTAGATCTVVSTGEDFVLNSGAPAYRDYSSSLPSGYGSPASWGSGFSAGSISCSVPQSYEAKGISCTDGSGHGFEASRVEDRKSTY